MPDTMTEPMEAYKARYASDDLDHEHDDHDDNDDDYHYPQILWGRVAILGAALVLAFLFGRMTKPAGIPESELAKAKERISELQEENDVLMTELAAAPLEGAVTTEEAPAETAAPAEGTAETVEGVAENDDGTDAATQEISTTYIVEEGDTLTKIARQFYGKPSYASLIAEANNLSDPGNLTVGQKLLIPEKPKR